MTENLDEQEMQFDDLECMSDLPDFLSVDAMSHHERSQESYETESNALTSISDAQRQQKISDAETYGPRFCQIFRTYSQTLSKPIDTTRHLMALCTDHLISFCKWARESEANITFIRETLLEHDYLRTEVRNGIVMVLIYTFASIKAEGIEGLDMFLTLQDADTGLGIANKFSLKIYNDPYFYLSFLKSSISGLIDAGAIPDNERQNQPKRNRVQFENQEELIAFSQLQNAIVTLLDDGNNADTRTMLLQITNYWQQKVKV